MTSLRGRIGVLLLVTSVLSGCATQDALIQNALIKETTSGYPEGIFKNSTVKEVKQKIIEGCVSEGRTISRDYLTNHVVCQESAGISASLWWRFAIHGQDKKVKVVARHWYQLHSLIQGAIKYDASGSAWRNNTQNFLFSLGAE